MTDHAELARHYGNMRFAMFTVFSAIVGGLVLIPLDKDRIRLVSTGGVHTLLGVSGIILAAAFAAAEIRISFLVNHYQGKAPEFDLTKLPSHRIWKFIVPTIMIIPYALSVVFWVLFLRNKIS